MRQQRYIMSAIFLLLFLFLFIGIFIKIPSWKAPKSDATIAYNVSKMASKEEQGKQLYFNNCIACHLGFNVNDGAYLTMSDLKNKWPNKNELIAYIKKSDDPTLQSNNRIKEIHKEFPNTSHKHHEFTKLPEAQIQLILDYIFEEVGVEKY